jgi:hypothetical protein
VLTTDGTVLVPGPGDAREYRLTPDTSGSYVSGTWTARERPLWPTWALRSALLADGQMFITSGDSNLEFAGIYDPATGNFTEIPKLGWHWIDGPACVLPDGRLIVGSVNDTRTAIYHPAANSWSDGPAKNDASRHETWTLLPDGTVLCADVQAHPHTEKYVPATNLSPNHWVSAGSIPAANDLVLQTTEDLLTGPAVLMPDGRVFAIGASGHTALYTPAPDPADAGSWAAGPDFPADDSGQPWGAPRAPAVLLPNGRVLCIVGSVKHAKPVGYAGEPCRAFEFDGTALTQVPDPPYADDSYTWQYRLLLLPTGEVLCATGDEHRLHRRIHVYQPDGEPDPAWAPVILSAASIVRPGGTFRLQGQQLNGLSQAHSDSDRAQMATNFPLVRIKSGARVHYCPTHGFSTMGVATGATVASTEVDVPEEVPVGTAQLSLVANGIATPSFWPIEIAPPAAWQSDNPSAAAGAVAAAGNPAGYVFKAQATQHVVYRGSDHHIHQLWWNSAGWHTKDLTKAAAGHPASPTGAVAAVGDPAGYVFDAQATQHVVYRGSDHHIHELWWNSAGWHGNDLTEAAGHHSASPTGAAPAAGDPAGYVFDARATQHVVYRGTDNHIHQLWWDTAGWRISDLTMATHAAPAAGDPSGYVSDADGGSQHVVYRGTDNHIHQLWWDTAGWHTNDLTMATHAAPAAGDPAGYVFNARATQHVVYRGADNHIYQLWWDITGWHISDVSAATGAVAVPGQPIVPTGAATAVGNPAGYVFDAHGGSQHVLYHGFDDRIGELRWG